MAINTNYSITHHLLGEFIPKKENRPEELKLRITSSQDPELVYLRFSEPISTLALLPCEAVQLHESLQQAVEGSEEEE